MRPYLIQIKCSEEEKKIIEKAAKLASKPTSTWIRDLALQTAQPKNQKNPSSE